MQSLGLVLECEEPHRLDLGGVVGQVVTEAIICFCPTTGIPSQHGSTAWNLAVGSISIHPTPKFPALLGALCAG